MNARDFRRAELQSALETLLRDMGLNTDDLYARHPDAQSLLEAGYPHLCAAVHNEDAALLLSLTGALAGYRRREPFGPHPRITNVRTAGAYLRTLFIGASVERFFLLSLNAAGRMIECALLQEGTLDETPFYLSHVLQRVAVNGADAVVLCHNHPAGTPRPSHADLVCTLDAIHALNPLGVTVLDHIIIAGNTAVSIREGGYIDSAVWLGQDETGKLLAQWTRKTGKET